MYVTRRPRNPIPFKFTEKYFIAPPKSLSSGKNTKKEQEITDTAKDLPC